MPPLPVGVGTALKPASEHWILVRKPLAGTVAETAATYGTGALNIDACRIGVTKAVPASPIKGRRNVIYGDLGKIDGTSSGFDPTVGRWPANLVLSHSEACELVGEAVVKGDGRQGGQGTRPAGFYSQGENGDGQPCGPLYGDATVPVYACAPDCAVAALDHQSGMLKSGLMKAGTQRRQGGGYHGYPPNAAAVDTYADAGGASRFFYCAKPSRKEREAGLADVAPRPTNDGRATPIDTPYQRGESQRKNFHPTVKPIDLMRYLIRLVTPADGWVLDPFCGSGSIGCAAVLEGRRYVGIEREADYVAIARRRIAYWSAAAPPTAGQ